MIEPFVEAQKREGVISYGLCPTATTRGCGRVQIFTNIDWR